MGQCFDKASNMIKKYEGALHDQEQIQAFIQTYNSKVKNENEKIP